jgi:hypothetical protein
LFAWHLPGARTGKAGTLLSAQGGSDLLGRWAVDSLLSRSDQKVDERLRDLVGRLLGLVVAGMDRLAA